jgi:MFS transporter, DHA2 family, multidrug resistance protein
MQSIFGALLTAGYADAVGAAIAAAPNASQITSSTQATLMKSFSSAEELAQRYPQYASAITAGARNSFLDGADWAYLAGMIAVLVGGAIVVFLFPRKDEGRRLLAEYRAADRVSASAKPQPPIGA